MGLRFDTMKIPHDMASFVSTITPELEQQLSDIRSRKGLKPVAADREGVPLGNLPEHIYGFTYSPVNDSTPLYAKRLLQSFEVHRLGGGFVEILGFVTPAEAETIRGGKEALDCKLYPEPREESNALVEIALERVARAKPVSRSDGNYMPLSLEPVH